MILKRLLLFFLYFVYRFRLWAARRPVAFAVLMFVLCGHVGLLFFLPSSWDVDLIKERHRQVLVRTVKLRPPEVISSPSSSADPSVTKEKPKAKPLQPKPSKKKPKKKKTPKKPKPLIRRNNAWQKEQDDLVALLKKNLRTWDEDQKEESLRVVIPVPEEIGKLNIDAVMEAQQDRTKEEGYHNELIERLRRMLRLPEYGEVKIRLLIDREGRVKDVSVVHSESSKNSAYIAKTIPSIAFPYFGDRFQGEQDHVFVMTLSNEL